MHRVGVVGVGFVGTAVSTGLEAVLGDDVEIREYDKFKDTESLESVVENSDIIFICLPTPMNDDGSCNTSIVEDGVRNVVACANKRKVIVLKSTVPPGTTQRLQDLYPKHALVFNPEFLTERNFIDDFIRQDRIILGYDPAHNIDRVLELYRSFIRKQKKSGNIYLETSGVAEMLKYVSNCYLSTKVALFNEFKEICDAVKIPYDKVIELLNWDVRVGKTHMKVPGPDGRRGFGGSCFPKDINALIAFARENEVDPMILDTVWTKNLLIREEQEWNNLAQVNGDYKKI